MVGDVKPSVVVATKLVIYHNDAVVDGPVKVDPVPHQNISPLKVVVTKNQGGVHSVNSFAKTIFKVKFCSIILPPFAKKIKIVSPNPFNFSIEIMGQNGFGQDSVSKIWNIVIAYF